MAVTFDDAIRLTRTDQDTYQCMVSPKYWISRGPNGGYLAALLAHAGDTHLGDEHRQLRGLTVYYLRPPAADKAIITVTTEQLGRSVAFQRIEMHQNGKKVLLATGSWADARTGIEHAAWRPPSAPDPADCPPMASVSDTGPFPIHEQWDIRSATGRAFGAGPPAEMTWWIRTPQHRTLDGPLLVAMSDALPPPIFMVAQPEAGVPTIDLTVHTRTDLSKVRWEPGDWVLASFRTRLGLGGYIEEDGELWTADGVLLAHCRQLALSI